MEVKNDRMNTTTVTSDIWWQGKYTRDNRMKKIMRCRYRKDGKR